MVSDPLDLLERPSIEVAPLLLGGILTVDGVSLRITESGEEMLRKTSIPSGVSGSPNSAINFFASALVIAAWADAAHRTNSTTAKPNRFIGSPQLVSMARVYSRASPAGSEASIAICSRQRRVAAPIGNRL